MRSATAWPAGSGSGTTTGRTIWPTTFNRRSRSSASRARRVFVREPEGKRRRGTLHPHAEGESVVGAGASTPSRSSAWPCLRSSERTTSSGCWRNTTIEVPLRCDVTSSGWTRQRRCEYRQTTVQEPWGATRVRRVESRACCRAGKRLPDPRTRLLKGGRPQPL